MSEALAAARAALARGDLFGAYDVATRAIEDGDASEDLTHQQALALARMGDTERALALFRANGLDRSEDPHKRALGARLLKDRGIETGSHEELTAAYRAYRQIFAESGDTDSYPAINAASLALLTGQVEDARALASQILGLPAVAEPSDYYCAATRAEALLIEHDPEAAAEALRLAVTLPGANSGAQAGTLRQLALVADVAGIPSDSRDALLALLRPPAAFHYVGHIFMANEETERRLKERIGAILDERNAAFAFGSAAAGADILVAETVLERGGEVHIVLPCATADFVKQSVEPAGQQWVARFESVLAAASSVGFASEMEFVNDPSIFAYGAAVAMGLARLRAQHLATHCFQLAIWDGSPGGEVGTAADVRLWREHGGETVVVEPEGVDRDYPRPAAGAPPPFPRRLASIIFTDYAGYSKLTESALPAFDREVMGRISDVLASHDGAVLASNTWGDALHAVVDGAATGADVALELQRSLSALDPAVLGLPSDQGGMRIAVHFGSIYEATDRITGRPNYQGTEVSRAARIEPVTPPDTVYVTEAFAAMIALHAPERFRCRYVGRIDLAKKCGTFPMYRLTAREGRR